MFVLDGVRVKIKVALQPGVYYFEEMSSTGKTRLYKLLREYAIAGFPVMGYSYSDYKLGIDFRTLVKPGVQKLLMVDRYDLYNGMFLEEIKEFAGTGIVLVDCKGDTELQCSPCFIEMSKDRIEVTE